jgi:hypothetical protein
MARMTTGVSALPPNMYLNLAAWLKIWSKHTPMKSMNISSADRAHAAGRRAHRRADVTRFRQRVSMQPVAVLGVQALGDAEHATPGVAFRRRRRRRRRCPRPSRSTVRVARHFLVERLVDRLLHADLA